MKKDILLLESLYNDQNRIEAPKPSAPIKESKYTVFFKCIQEGFNNNPYYKQVEANSAVDALHIVYGEVSKSDYNIHENHTITGFDTKDKCYITVIPAKLIKDGDISKLQTQGIVESKTWNKVTHIILESRKSLKGKLVNEGLWDRLKAGTSGVVAGAKQGVANWANTGADTGLTGQEAKANAKSASLFKSHQVKIQQALDGYASDLVKSGVLPQADTQKFVQGLMTQVTNPAPKQGAAFNKPAQPTNQTAPVAPVAPQPTINAAQPVQPTSNITPPVQPSTSATAQPVPAPENQTQQTGKVQTPATKYRKPLKNNQPKV